MQTWLDACASAEMICLATDQDWLHKTTKEVAKTDIVGKHQQSNGKNTAARPLTSRNKNKIVKINQRAIIRAMVTLGVCCGIVRAAAITYHVDASAGNDRNDGISPAAAWRSLQKVNLAELKPGDNVLFKRGEIWRGQLFPQSGSEEAPITYGAYGEGAKPLLLGSVSRNKPKYWLSEGKNIWSTIDVGTNKIVVDVGNIIFNQGKSVGVKKWKLADLKQPGDYWYSAETGQIKLYAEKNPAESYQSIELALRQHIISEDHKSYVVYENLALKYGAAHGFGGASTHHIIIRQCDVSWIGGGHQFTTPEGRPVRFGNGIEFWSNAHDNLVEGCRIWEIYDAALTNQGDNNNTEANIIYRNNVIWNCEYSFEYWNGKMLKTNAPQLSKTKNIRFEFNTCVNAGYGWGHAQRPDPNGRHLMFSNNRAETSNFYVCNNIFYQATDSDARFSNDWRASLTLDHNCWYQSQGTLILFLKTPWTSAQFGEYQKQTKLDAHSIVSDPKFTKAEALDFRLTPDSPALKLSTEGGSVGAQQRLVD